jgi:DNA polymerase I
MTGDSSDESEETVTIDLYSVEYTVPDDSTEPIVHCFGADPDGEYRHIRVTGFEPYLYVPLTESPSRTEVTASDTMKRLERLNSSGEPHTTPTGTEMMKIVTYTPGDVAEVRDKFENPHESDIVFSQRFLTDMKIRSGMQLPASVVADSEPVHARHIEPVDVNHPWRIHYTDIEVEDRAGFPENGQHPILCITAYDSLEQQYIVWLQGACAKSAADMNPSSDLHDDPVDIRWYESEADMLRSYFAYIRATRPAVMTAWNLPFDAEYLIDRANTLRYDHDTPVGLDQLSPLRHVTNPDSQSTNVKGVEMFDLLTGFKSTQFTELDSYRLDDITAEFLDVSKETYDGTIGDLWETDPEALVSYNIRDVALVVELDRRQDIIPFWRELRSQAVCTLSDATTESTVADRYLLSEYQETVFPNQRSAEADESDFSGGAVMEPIDGIREMVSVLDLASLYPMSMLTLNASPETRVDPDEYDGETITSPNDVHFRTDTEGLTRQMIVSLLSEREEKKQLRSECDPESEQYAVYDRQQRAVKVVMNTLYGVLSWDQFRLYDQATAAAVTATGRGVLEHTQSTVSDEGYEVLYGDTDSVMLGMKHVTPTPDTVVTDELVDATPALSEDDRKQLQAIIDESHRLEDVINDSYDTFAENVLGTSDHRFDIEFEKLYQRYFQAGKKKRYAGSAIWKEGNFVDSVDITGFDFVRSDVSAFARELQREVIEMILDGADRQDILRHMTAVLDRWDNRAVSIDDIGVPGGFSSPMNSYDTDIHTVRAAKFGNLLLGSSFSQGAKSKRYYLDGVSERFYDETVPDELDPSRDRLYQSFIDDTPMLAVSDGHDVPPGVTLDWDRMRDKNIRSPMEGILLSLDIDWDELLADGSQTGLHAFCD